MYVTKVYIGVASVKFTIVDAVEFHVLTEWRVQTMGARYSVKAPLLAG